MLFEQGQLILSHCDQWLEPIEVGEHEGKKVFLAGDNTSHVYLDAGMAVMFFKRWLREFDHGYASKMVVLHNGRFHRTMNWYFNDKEIKAEWKKSL